MKRRQRATALELWGWPLGSFSRIENNFVISRSRARLAPTDGFFVNESWSDVDFSSASLAREISRTGRRTGSRSST